MPPSGRVLPSTLDNIRPESYTLLMPILNTLLPLLASLHLLSACASPCRELCRDADRCFDATFDDTYSSRRDCRDACEESIAAHWSQSDLCGGNYESWLQCQRSLGCADYEDECRSEYLAYGSACE